MNGLSLNCEVLVINTVIRNTYECDLLVLDEVHRFAASTFANIFEIVSYKYILGLTATFERLDEKHKLIEQYCPVIDTVSLLECKINNWISDYKEYLVILDVDDIDEYKTMNKEFTKYFEYFNFDWNKVSSCLGENGFKYRAKLRDEMCPRGSEEERKRVFQTITAYATQFMRIVRERKAFINNHPKKLEIARKIIKARSNSKIITFSNNVKMAESVGIGYVYSGKDSKKKGRMTIEEFSKIPFGVLNTIKKANEGLDCPGLAVGIMLGIDSSKINKIQKVGRVIRKEDDKQAEIFTLIIDQTVELDWFKRSNTSNDVIIIDESGLNDVLNGKEPKPYVKPLKNFTFRF